MKTLKKNIYLTLTCILVLSLNTLGQLKVASNGFVGVGTLTPLKQFHVAGGDALIQCATDKNFEIVNWDVSRNGCVTLNARNDLNNSHIPMSFASSCFYFHYGSVGIGRIPFFKLDVNGDIRVNTTIYTSDETLKSNIQPIKTQVDNLFRVKSVSYYFKDAQLTSANNSSKKSSDNITEEKDMRIPGSAPLRQRPARRLRPRHRARPDLALRPPARPRNHSLPPHHGSRAAVRVVLSHTLRLFHCDSDSGEAGGLSGW